MLNKKDNISVNHKTLLMIMQLVGTTNNCAHVRKYNLPNFTCNRFLQRNLLQQ